MRQQAYQKAAAQRAQVVQQQAYQQAVLQYQAQQLEQARQMMMQQALQAYVQQQVQAYIQKAQVDLMQQAVVKHAIEERMAEEMAAMIAQGVTQIRQEHVQQAMAQTLAYVAQQQMAQQAAMAKQVGMTRQMAIAQGDQAVEEADITDVWAKLSKNSLAWALLIDNDAKVMTVDEFIRRFKSQNVKIRNTPQHYVDMIDEMSSQDVEMLQRPFKEILQLMAIMEYDFDNGTDKDALARRILGDQMYEANLERLKAEK